MAELPSIGKGGVLPWEGRISTDGGATYHTVPAGEGHPVDSPVDEPVDEPTPPKSRKRTRSSK